jgi:hypothetical protein
MNAMPKRTITAEDAPYFLEKLTCDDIKAQEDSLGQLCPCRSRCYDQEIWAAICRAFDSPLSEKNVVDRAFHAIETLVEHAGRDTEARELLDWLEAERLLTLPLERPGGPPTTREGVRVPKKKQHRKITSRDIPHLLEKLTFGDVNAQCSTLRLLCPCRNVRYDEEVWLTIFRVYETSDRPGVRHDAVHAIGTLLERARTDPRSQDLLRRLVEKGIRSISLETSIPTWRPFNRNDKVNGLTIPRWERSHRSKVNRRH